MKKVSLVFIAGLLLLITSCATLKSGTNIEPNDEFVLGKNEHGPFRVKMRNTSNDTIVVYKAPINGGRHSAREVAPGMQSSFKVDANTALVFFNPSGNTVTIALNVRGDLGLNMEYSK